jgi:hypothetical protein
MQRLRQRHADNSQSVIELRNSKWQVQVTVSRNGGSLIKLVGIYTTNVDEAKKLAAKAMKVENRGHSCSEDCLAWEEF